MREAYDVAPENLQVAARRNKRYYDMQVKQKSFVVGEAVYYYNPRRFQGDPKNGLENTQALSLLKRCCHRLTT